jgi:beta-glucuronidase
MKRRSLLAAAGLSPLALSSAVAAPAADPFCGEVSLCGPWQFKTEGRSEWQTVQVPHTWQTAMPDHLGRAVYRREFFVPANWKGQTVRAEFEAVYHTAEVTVNGVKAGEHQGKGYTAFIVPLTPHLKPGAVNVIEVTVDNRFRDDMLPRNASYDWTPDGGIYRPVTLHVTPAIYIDTVLIDAFPSADFRSATVEVRVELGGTGTAVPVECEIVEESTGRRFGSVRSARPKFTVENPKLWHFDHPHLYTAHLRLGAQTRQVTFGIRRFEVKGSSFYLNGEKIRPTGVERMAGSHPVYGMAEPLEWIEHDQRDMKELNCVFTRVHWMQDRRLLDWCDRNGMMMQLEVPSWGPDTFKGMPAEPGAALMNNALEQLREMVRRDYNHPSVVIWGLCNEINGQGAAQKVFVRRLKEEARKLDPHRPLTYASHSLFNNPGNDISGEMDFVSWNQYFGSWQKGGVAELKAGLQAVIQAFPGKPIVISEYGYCACTADRPEGDIERIAVLEQQNALLRGFPEIAGLIFFCYNDYRTHMGDKGEGVLKQRVHGVVDVFGNRKPSYPVLRLEASPIESLQVEGGRIRIRNRADVPAYTLRGYVLRWTAFGRGEIPLRTADIPLADLAPGASAEVAAPLKQEGDRRIRLDIMRPTGDSAYTRWI